MSERCTIRDARQAFQQFADVLGKSTNPYPLNQRGAVVGAWHLDYNPIYGGCRIEEITNEAGGTRNPFVAQRLSPREFCMAISAAFAALRLTKTPA